MAPDELSVDVIASWLFAMIDDHCSLQHAEVDKDRVNVILPDGQGFMLTIELAQLSEEG